MKILRAVTLFLLLFASLATAEEKRFAIPVGDSPQKGLKDAPVTIVEFIDFQ